MIADLPSVGRGDKNIAKTAFTCNNKYENEWGNGFEIKSADFRYEEKYKDS
jgi:hypothetical protein